MLTVRHNSIPLRMVPEQDLQAQVESMRINPACEASTQVRGQTGFTLIELMVGIVVVGILFALGAPSFKNWLQSAQIRTSAESILNGLQIAKSEAVHRNAPVRFQLVSDLTATCAPAVSGTSWIVSLDDPTSVVASPAFCSSLASDTVAPRIIQLRSSAEGSPNAVVAADVSFISFNGLGRTHPPGSSMTISVSNPTGGVCVAQGGPMRCMNILVSAGGQVRMCDPVLVSDPQGC